MVTLGGFGMISGLIRAMINRGLNISEGGLALIFAAFMVIVIVDWMLIRQLSRMTAKPQVPDEADDKASKRKLSEKRVAQIAAPREPASSVTDNTTRTFEPVYRERDTRQ